MEVWLLKICQQLVINLDCLICLGVKNQYNVHGRELRKCLNTKFDPLKVFSNSKNIDNSSVVVVVPVF